MGISSLFDFYDSYKDKKIEGYEHLEVPVEEEEGVSEEEKRRRKERQIEKKRKKKEKEQQHSSDIPPSPTHDYHASSGTDISEMRGVFGEGVATTVHESTTTTTTIDISGISREKEEL